jgi:hypothetical protein
VRTCNVANRNLVQRGQAGAASAPSAYPLGVLFDASVGKAVPRGRAQNPALASANGSSSATLAASSHSSPRLGYRTVRHTARLACSRTIGDITVDHRNRIDFLVDTTRHRAARIGRFRIVPQVTSSAGSNLAARHHVGEP